MQLLAPHCYKYCAIWNTIGKRGGQAYWNHGEQTATFVLERNGLGVACPTKDGGRYIRLRTCSDATWNRAALLLVATSTSIWSGYTAWTGCTARYFSLLHRFNRLEPPPPVDLVGLTVAKGDVPILNLTTEIFDNIASFCSGMTLTILEEQVALTRLRFWCCAWIKARINANCAALDVTEGKSSCFPPQTLRIKQSWSPFQMQLHPFHPSTTYKVYSCKFGNFRV